jgi:hypothetical protein
VGEGRRASAWRRGERRGRFTKRTRPHRPSYITDQPGANRIRDAADRSHKTNPQRCGSIAARLQNEAVQPTALQNELHVTRHCVRQRFYKTNRPDPNRIRAADRSHKTNPQRCGSIAAHLQNEAVQPTVLQNELQVTRHCVRQRFYKTNRPDPNRIRAAGRSTKRTHCGADRLPPVYKTKPPNPPPYKTNSM